MQNDLIISSALIVLGLVAGSFAGATVWRLRARQLKFDAKHGEKVTVAEKKEVAKLQKKPLHSDRSVCLHCGHELAWYDLLPLVSWLQLGGKCRYCHKPIGWLEPALELGVAAFFIVSYLAWPLALAGPIGVAQLALWLVASVGMAILIVYDAKWFLLPNSVVFPLIGLGAAYSLLELVGAHFAATTAVSIFAACMVLSGLYYLIYVFSQGQWVGFGDIKLGLALALLLADWRLAVLALFLANLIGTVLFMPALLSGKLKSQAHIPFGPLLIAGWAIAGLFGEHIIQWYMTLTLGLS